MRWHPRVTVAAVIRDSKGRYLLVDEQPDGELVLNQPAGHLENGESLLEAVVREVREETCREFSPHALLGIYRWRASAGGDTFLRFCFLGEAGPINADLVRDPDILATHWLSPEELDGGPHTLRSPLVSRSIRDAERGQSFPLDLLVELTPAHA